MVIRKIPEGKLDSAWAQEITGKSPKTFNRNWTDLRADPEKSHLATLVVIDGVEKKLIDKNHFLSKYPIKVPPDKMEAFLAWDQDQNELDNYIAQNDFLQKKLLIKEKSLAEITKSRDHYKNEYDILYEFYQEKCASNANLIKDLEELSEKVSTLPEPKSNFMLGLLVGFIGVGTIIWGARFLWRRYVKS